MKCSKNTKIDYCDSNFIFHSKFSCDVLTPSKIKLFSFYKTSKNEKAALAALKPTFLVPRY